MAANTEAALIMQEAEQPAEPPAAPQEEEKPQRRRWRGPLQRYKEWVRAHPGLVGNLDLLSYLVVYNPLRSSSPGSVELTTEACHASVGLLSLWHQSIIDEEHAPVPRPAASLWLDAVEQVSAGRAAERCASTRQQWRQRAGCASAARRWRPSSSCAACTWSSTGA